MVKQKIVNITNSNSSNIFRFPQVFQSFECFLETTLSNSNYDVQAINVSCYASWSSSSCASVCNVVIDAVLISTVCGAWRRHWSVTGCVMCASPTLPVITRYVDAHQWSWFFKSTGGNMFFHYSSAHFHCSLIFVFSFNCSKSVKCKCFESGTTQKSLK